MYQILGPSRSSMLAYGNLGRLFLKILYKDLNKERVFYSNEKIKLKLTPQEASLLGLIFFGSINPQETKLIKDKLKSGDIFIDVGAYIDGWHSLVAAKRVGNQGKVYTFEPHPIYYQRLSQNVKLNKFKNIKLEQVAVSNKIGLKTFYVAENLSSFYRKHIVGYNNKQKPIKVKTTTLDHYIQTNKIDKINLVKVDVECAEMEVLKGARKLLSRKNAPDLLIEVVDTYLKIAGSSEKEVLQFLRSFGYKAYTLEPSGLSLYNGISSKRDGVNLFFSRN